MCSSRMDFRTIDDGISQLCNVPWGNSLKQLFFEIKREGWEKVNKKSNGTKARTHLIQDKPPCTSHVYEPFLNTISIQKTRYLKRCDHQVIDGMKNRFTPKQNLQIKDDMNRCPINFPYMRGEKSDSIRKHYFIFFLRESGNINASSRSPLSQHYLRIC